MTALASISLGTPPGATDGDTVRTGFTKFNSNVAVLNTQTALISGTAITTPQALTAANVGTRVNISLSAAGVINLPTAATCAADNVILLRNVGAYVATLAVTTGSGDNVALSRLNPGEAALMDTDGVHAWNVLMRGRTNSDNEVVNGNCTVNGNETVGGTFAATGLATLTGGASFGASGQATLSSAGAYSGVSAAYTANVTVGGTFAVTGTSTFTGASTFTARPTFAGKTPWDNGNLPSTAFFNTNNSNLLKTWWDSSVGGMRLTVDAGYTGALVNTNSNNTIKLGWTGSTVTLTVDSTTLGAITTSSDYRAKQNVVPLPGIASETVKRLRPVEYEWRDFDLFKADGKRHAGFIAHEAQEVIPSAASGTKDGVDDQGNPVIQNLVLAPIVATLTAALQEAFLRIEALEGK